MKTKDFIELLEEYVCMSGDKELSLTASEIADIFEIDTRKCAGMLSYYRNHRDEFPSNHIDVMYMPIDKKSPGVWVIVCRDHDRDQNEEDIASYDADTDSFKEDSVRLIKTIVITIASIILSGLILKLF